MRFFCVYAIVALLVGGCADATGGDAEGSCDGSLTEAVNSKPDGDAGGQGGASGNGGSSTVCDPGGRYVCDCGNGNTGNKFCAWDGQSFSSCELCGQVASEVFVTSTPCNLDPQMFNPCPTIDEYCVTHSCPAVDTFCVVLSCQNFLCTMLTALPTAMPPDVIVNDCESAMCDGFGNRIPIPDPLDCNGTCDVSGVCNP